MVGELFKRKSDGVWMIRYQNPNFISQINEFVELPVYHKNLTESDKWSMYQGMKVNFDIIDEFTHPHLYRDVGLFEGNEMVLLKFK